MVKGVVGCEFDLFLDVLGEVVVEEGDVLLDLFADLLVVLVVLALEVGGALLVDEADEFGAHVEVALHAYFLQAGVVGAVVVDLHQQSVVDQQQLFLLVLGLPLGPLPALGLLMDPARQLLLLLLLLGLVQIPQHAVELLEGEPGGLVLVYHLLEQALDLG